MTGPNRIQTSHGVLAVEEHGRGDTPVLMIHGNSSCRAVFHCQQDASFAERYRIIAFDLPGHGESSDAPDPYKTYTLQGLAEATLELLGALRITRPVVFGWSLGGHIAIELLSRLPGMRALLLTGAPPVGKLDGRNNIGQGYCTSPRVLGKDQWSSQEAEEFVKTVLGGVAPPVLVDAAVRTDRRFRRRLLESSREGGGTDLRRTVEAALLPIAVINGADDPLVNLDYFDCVRFSRLWGGEARRLPGLGHAPFWQRPEVFNVVFESFLDQLDTSRREVNRSTPEQQWVIDGSKENR